MDYILQSRPTPLDLYHRWENQNWSTQKLDFTEDRAHWASMSDRLGLMEAGVRDRSHLERIDATIFRLLEAACRIVAAPDRKYAIAPEDTPPNLLINPCEVGTFSLVSLTKRLRTLGLSTQACEEVTKRGNLYYTNAWNEYEDIHGEEHPRRFFDRFVPVAT